MSKDGSLFNSDLENGEYTSQKPTTRVVQRNQKGNKAKNADNEQTINEAKT